MFKLCVWREIFLNTRFYMDENDLMKNMKNLFMSDFLLIYYYLSRVKTPVQMYW